MKASVSLGGISIMKVSVPLGGIPISVCAKIELGAMLNKIEMSSTTNLGSGIPLTHCGIFGKKPNPYTSMFLAILACPSAVYSVFITNGLEFFRPQPA